MISKKDHIKFVRKHQILICMLFIFLINIRYITKIGIFTVLDDEFGYWGNAAYLFGLNWSDAISEIPYYSYGYSLILVPLFQLFDNPIYMYKAAIILNAIMISLCFLICYNIAQKLVKKTNDVILINISILISMYPTYIAYSRIAWSECLLIFMFWLLCWLFLGLNNESQSFKFILIGFCSAYVYIIHQRALGILVASVFIIILMRILNKIKNKHLFQTLIPIFIVFIIHRNIKDDIQTNLWLTNLNNLTNDYSGQLSKLRQLLTLNGLYKLLRTFLGHFFYIGVSSYLIGYIGLYELFQKIVNTVRAFIKSKNIYTFNQESNFYFYIFIFISIIFSLIINVIFMINPTRADHLVYGRYIDMIMGIIILLGFIKLINYDLNNKIFLLILIFFIILTLGINDIIKESKLIVFHSMQAIGLLFIHTPFGVYIPAFIAILACSLIYLSVNKYTVKKLSLSLFVITICFLITGNIVANNIAKSNQNTMAIVKIVEYINKSDDKLPIYYLWDDYQDPEYGKWDNRNTMKRLIADCYQFLLKDKSVYIVNNFELNSIKEPKYLIINGNIDKFNFLNNYKFCISINDNNLYLLK